MAKRVRRTVEDSRANILSAAELLVRERGPTEFTLTEIARRAKTTHPNIIARFGSALELQRKTASRIAQAIISEIADELTAERTTADPLRQSLQTLFRRLSDDGNRQLFAWILLHDSAHRLPGLDSGLQRLMDLWEQRAQARGSGRIDRQSIGLTMRLAIGAALGNGLAGGYLQGLAKAGPGSAHLADAMADLIDARMKVLEKQGPSN